MKDLPVTARIVILGTLVLTLAGILWQIAGGPTEGLRSDVVVPSEGERAAKPVPPAAVFYPPVPVVLPDLNDGYLFNREREFEEVVMDRTRGVNGMVDLAEVTYAGSLIVGEIYKGLVIYQKKSPVARKVARASRRTARARRTAVKTEYKYKQLELGEKFMGYLVEKIAKDRIVFKKGDEVVEIFLYDQNKDRAALGSAAKSKTPKAIRTVPRTPAPQAVSRPPRNIARKTAAAKAKEVMVSSGRDPQAAAAELIKSKSERLLGLDPSLGMPLSPGVPGDPLRR